MQWEIMESCEECAPGYSANVSGSTDCAQSSSGSVAPFMDGMKVDLDRLGQLRGLAPLATFLLIVVFFTNQALAQHDLFRCWKEAKACKTDLYLLPKQLDEKVARLHIPVHGATLTVLTQPTVHTR